MQSSEINIADEVRLIRVRRNWNKSKRILYAIVLWKWLFRCSNEANEKIKVNPTSAKIKSISVKKNYRIDDYFATHYNSKSTTVLRKKWLKRIEGRSRRRTKQLKEPKRTMTQGLSMYQWYNSVCHWFKLNQYKT